MNFGYVLGENGTNENDDNQYLINAFGYYYGKNFSYNTPSSNYPYGYNLVTPTIPSYQNCIINNNTNEPCPFEQGCGSTNTKNLCSQKYSPPSSISAAQLSSNYNMVTLSNANYPCKRYFGNNVSSQLYPGNYLLMK
jgi:hypothetical protein